METKDKGIIERIKKESREFRILSEKHQELEEKLNKMDKKVHLNVNEEIERKKMQKLKLLNKDKMERILERYENN